MYKYLVLYRNLLNYRCFASFQTREQAEQYAKSVTPQYSIIDIVELAVPISY